MAAEEEKIKTSVDDTTDDQRVEGIDSILNVAEGKGDVDESLEDEELQEKVDEEPCIGDFKDKELADEEEEEEKLKADDVSKINPEYVKAARVRGFSDEEIAASSEKALANNYQLMNFHAAQEAAEEEEEEVEETTPVNKVEYTPEAIAKINEQHGDNFYETVIKPIVDVNNAQAEQLNSMKSDVNKGSERRQAEALARDENTFNTLLDGESKNYPEFGQWDKVPINPDGSPDMNSPIIEARLRMWNVAKALQEGMGLTMSAAAEEAVKWYKGQSLEKDVKRKVVKDLAKRAKKFSPRPSNKKTKKVFSNPDEKDLEATRNVMDKLGLHSRD